MSSSSAATKCTSDEGKNEGKGQTSGSSGPMESEGQGDMKIEEEEGGGDDNSGVGVLGGIVSDVAVGSGGMTLEFGRDVVVENYIQDQINLVEGAIIKVEHQIEGVEKELETATGDDRAYFREKEKQLREKEKQLREEKKQLREERAREQGGGSGAAAAALQPSDLRVVDQSQFIGECRNIPSGNSGCPRDRLVGLQPIMERAVNFVVDGVAKCTGEDGDYRVSPLVFSRLARGGKTTALKTLFDCLKDVTMHCSTTGDSRLFPIIISFNGQSGFKLRTDEQPVDAILRVVAAQLVNCTREEKQRIVCSRAALDDYFQNKKVVLLIDELNALACPLDSDSAALLREMFLDPVDRYLVYSTHVPLGVDPPATLTLGKRPQGMQSSLRLCHVVELPTCFGLEALRAMHPIGLSGLTQMEVALYGGIPSLIYSVKGLREGSPEVRFNRSRLLSCDLDNRDAQLHRFVREVLTGNQNADLFLRQFDAFGSFSEEAKIRWPLCYVSCILEFLNRDVYEAVNQVVETIKKLESTAKTTNTGMEWEAILEIALQLRCIDSQFNGTAGPLGVSHGGQKPTALFCRIPAEIVEANAELRDWLIERVRECDKFPVIILATPANGCFVAYDGFLAYQQRTDVELRICGYQAKAGNAYPKKPKADILAAAHLLRGKAPRSEFENPSKPGWRYWGRENVADLLGFSMKPLIQSVPLDDAPSPAAAQGGSSAAPMEEG